MPSHACPSDDQRSEQTSAARVIRVNVLKKRADFLRASRAARAVTPGFILQMRRRTADGTDAIRIGFTCSKKVGNAVARNRAKRRLRALASEILPTCGHADTDYVLIGRVGATATRPFDQMCDDLKRALHQLAQSRK